jgi:osmotically-inducible protein OsmY
MFKIIILLIFLLQSCVATIIGGIAVTSTTFTRYEPTVFNSRLIRTIKNDVNHVLHKNNHAKSAIQLAQDGNSVYVVGLVSSNDVKTQVLEAVTQKLGGSYIDEIAVSSTKHAYLRDAILKFRLKKHLIFTKHLKSQNYQIFIYNKKAYLIGRTSGDDEKELLIKTLEAVSYVTDVVIYIT